MRPTSEDPQVSCLRNIAIVAICVERVLACKIVEKRITGEVFEDFSLVRHKFSVVDIYIPPA